MFLYFSKSFSKVFVSLFSLEELKIDLISIWSNFIKLAKTTKDFLMFCASCNFYLKLYRIVQRS